MTLRSNTAISPKGKQRLISIITAGKRTLALEGYENFTLRKIAKKLDISLAAIQHYFASKEDLLNAVIDDEINTYEEHWQLILSRYPQDPIRQLDLFLSIILDLHLEEETSGFILQFWALSATNPNVHQKMQTFYMSFFNKLTAAQRALSPNLNTKVYTERSLLIASIIEGTLIFIAGNRRIAPDIQNIRQNAKSLALSLLEN